MNLVKMEALTQHDSDPDAAKAEKRRRQSKLKKLAKQMLNTS